MDATVDFFGVKRQLRLDIVDEPVIVGDYVLNHVGFAIRRIPEQEIGVTLQLYDTILKEAAAGDLMAADVSGEMSGAARVEPPVAAVEPPAERAEPPAERAEPPAAAAPLRSASGS